MTMNNSDGREDSSSSANLSMSHSPSLPPLHPQGKKSSNNGATPPSSSSSPPSQQKFPTWRSFSLSDLQGMDAAAPSIKGLADKNKGERDNDNEVQH